MSLDPDELAIREAFERRRPAAVPSELLVRVAAVPGEVRPLRPMPVRLALGVAPWVAVAAVGITLVWGPSMAASWPSVAGSPGSEPSVPTVSPAGAGFADRGLFGLPWVPYLLWVAIVAIGTAAVRLRRGGHLSRPVLAGRHVLTIPMLILLVLLVAIPAAAISDARSGQAIVSGAVVGPGPEVGEVSGDGVWYDLDERRPSTSSGSCPDWPRCIGPHWIYRLRPGQTYSFVAAVRNQWPIPITVLGRVSKPHGAGPTGLGLLADPSLVSADPANVVPFRAVQLLPGQEVSFVVIDVAPPCADPGAKLAEGSEESLSLPTLVYDALGWRRHADVMPRFQLTIAGCDGPG